jgi:divalent metal cation (Fe/Co/Zn/Cd) transporter
VERTIDRVVEEERAVRAVRDLRTMHLGPHTLLVVVSVEFAPDLEAGGVHAAVTRLHARLAEALGDITDARLIVIEPAPVTDRGAPRAA